MSTRCQVAIEGSPILVYRHCDGYPDTENGVLATLLPFRDRFWAGRGYDASYFLARLLMEWVSLEEQACQYARVHPEDRWSAYALEPQVLGFGVDTEIHGDIEYLYLVRRDGTAEVYRPNYAAMVDGGSIDVETALARGEFSLHGRHPLGASAFDSPPSNENG
jgi:hypothetical protein